MSVNERARVLNSEFRTAVLNEKYYGCRLHAAQRFAFWLDLSIALTSSSAVAGWTIWRTGTGSIAWQLAGAVTTLLAITKPFLRLADQIERYTELKTGYCTIAFDLERETTAARVSGTISDQQWEKINAIVERNRDLNVKDDPVPHERFRAKCAREVNRQWPIERLWWGPTRKENGNDGT